MIVTLITLHFVLQKKNHEQRFFAYYSRYYESAKLLLVPCNAEALESLRLGSTLLMGALTAS